MYKVTKKFGRSETQVGMFRTINEAKKFIQDKLAEDAKLNLNAIYCLYEGMDLMEEFNQSHLEATEEQNSGAAGQQRGSGKSFSPSPFNTSPAPRGTPRAWTKDDSDKNDTDK